MRVLHAEIELDMSCILHLFSVYHGESWVCVKTHCAISMAFKTNTHTFLKVGKNRILIKTYLLPTLTRSFVDAYIISAGLLCQLIIKVYLQFVRGALYEMAVDKRHISAEFLSLSDFIVGNSGANNCRGKNRLANREMGHVTIFEPQHLG